MGADEEVPGEGGRSVWEQGERVEGEVKVVVVGVVTEQGGQEGGRGPTAQAEAEHAGMDLLDLLGGAEM